MDMPQDMVLEIFSWLSAKSISKFKCMDKFCNALPSKESSYFIHKHSQNVLSKDDSCFFLQPNCLGMYGAKFEFYNINPKDTASGISKGFRDFYEQNPNWRIIASSKGLILGHGNEELFICNPVTQTWLPIPTPHVLKSYPSYDYFLGITLECDVQDSNDFMLYLFECQDEWASPNRDVKFYSVEEGIWKSIGESFFGGRNMRFDVHVYYGKALHFVSDCGEYFCKRSPYYRPYIIAYNVEDGSSRMIKMPKKVRIDPHDSTWQTGIYKWEKSTSSHEPICLVRLSKHVFTIWVLSDYLIGTWRRILKIRVKAMGLKEKDPLVTGFTVVNGDKLIFTTEKKIYGYGLRKDNFMKLEEICEHGFEDCNATFILHLDTLRSCGHIYEKLPSIQQH